MAVEIEVPASFEASLIAEAEARGLTLKQYVDGIVTGTIPPAGAVSISKIAAIWGEEAEEPVAL